MIAYYVTFSSPHLVPSSLHKQPNKTQTEKLPKSPKLYFFSHQKANCEKERLITILLEGMKMALEFLLGPYPFLFVVIATGKILGIIKS